MYPALAMLTCTRLHTCNVRNMILVPKWSCADARFRIQMLMTAHGGVICTHKRWSEGKDEGRYSKGQRKTYKRALGQTQSTHMVGGFIQRLFVTSYRGHIARSMPSKAMASTLHLETMDASEGEGRCED